MLYAELDDSAVLSALIVAPPPFAAFLVVGETGFIVRPLFHKAGDHFFLYLHMTANLIVPGTLAAAALGIH